MLFFESSPFADDRTAEGLRMGLGLTICNDNVSVAFADNAINALRKTVPGNIPDVVKPLEMLCEMKKTIYAVKSKNMRFDEKDSPYTVTVIEKDKFFELLTDSDVVITC